MRTAIILTLLAPSVASAQGVWRGPYLTNASTSAMTIVWETPSAETGIVRYGLTNAVSETPINVGASSHQAVTVCLWAPSFRQSTGHASG